MKGDEGKIKYWNNGEHQGKRDVGREGEETKREQRRESRGQKQ